MQQDGNDNNNQYSDNLTEEERRSRQRLEYNEDDNQGEIQKREETIAQVSLANLGIPKSDRTWHARLPNFLNLETTPFDENVWEPKEDEFDESQEGGTSTPGGSQKAAVLDENVIRWRWGTDQMGNDVSSHLIILDLSRCVYLFTFFLSCSFFLPLLSTFLTLSR